MKKSDKAYEVKIDENREIRGKYVEGGVRYQIINGRAITCIQLTMEAVCAMFNIMGMIEVDKYAELSKKARKAMRK